MKFKNLGKKKTNRFNITSRLEQVIENIEPEICMQFLDNLVYMLIKIVYTILIIWRMTNTLIIMHKKKYKYNLLISPNKINDYEYIHCIEVVFSKQHLMYVVCHEYSIL